MRFRILSHIALLLTIAALWIGSPASAQAQVVKLDGQDIQVVLDQLFGSKTSDGLLDGTKHFELHAENVVMTPEQADKFFVPSLTNPEDISDLILKAEGIKGSELKISGSLGGDSFEVKLSGKQVKIDGLVMTQAEFDRLVAELKATPGLHEAKLEATVDGERLVAKLQNVPGRVRIEHHGFTDEGPHPVPHTEPRADKSKSDARLALADHEKRPDNAARPEKIEKIERPEKVEKIERPEKIEKIERPEKIEKIERIEKPVKVERIEKPEVAQSGKGRG